MNVKDKYILITGASSGIGEALAKEIGKCGGIPILIARRKEELERIKNEIKKNYNRECLYFPCDITDHSDRLQLLDFIKTLPELSVVIHNAGITIHGKFENSTEDALRKVFEINFFSAVEITRLLLPVLKATPSRKIIGYVSTPSSLYGIPERFGYSSSKAAGQLFFESISHEVYKDNIHVMIFLPGYTKTNLRTSGLTSDGQKLEEEQAKDAKDPEEVAKIFCDAIRKEKKYVFTNLTGRIIFYLRVISPSLLDKLVRSRHK